MKARIFFLFLVNLVFSQIFSQIKSVSQISSDLMCVNRVTKESSGSDVQVVENPWITPRNSSNNVLRAYNINKSGIIWLNLYKYYDLNTSALAYLPSENQIDLAANPQYKGLRFKYFIKGNTLGANLTSQITLMGYTAQQSSVQWTYIKETGVNWTDWNTVSFTFALNVHCERIQINLYNGGTYSSTITPNVEIFIDDIEFFDPTVADISIPMIENNLNYSISGKQLMVYDVHPKSVITIYNLYGMVISTTHANANTFEYLFSKSGIYMINIKNGNNSIIKKVLIN